MQWAAVEKQYIFSKIEDFDLWKKLYITDAETLLAKRKLTPFFLDFKVSLLFKLDRRLLIIEQ